MKKQRVDRRRAGHIETLLIGVGGIVGCLALVAIGERSHLKPWLKSQGAPWSMMLGLILLAAAVVVGTLLTFLLHSLLIKFFEWNAER